MTDSEKLLKLAEWFDVYDAEMGNIGANEVQTSLREIAKRIESIDSHRSRLIESVKKWGGAWRKCRAELKEARKEIERLKTELDRARTAVKEFIRNELKTK